MKNIAFVLLLGLMCQITTAQKIDKENAPRNPIGFKHKKEHFFLEGDIYASDGKTFDRNGNLVYNYGTRYYYDDNGRIIGNNYNDVIKLDARGNVTTFKYNSGSEYTYKFNDKNLLVYEENTYGDETTYEYDSKDRLVKAIMKRKGKFYQERNFTYSKKGDTLIVDIKYIKENNQPGFEGKSHYLNGYLVKEELSSGTYEYIVETDSKGNKSNFYTANVPDARHFETFNRYYSDLNKPMKLEFGYYIPGGLKKGKKQEAVYINGKHAKDIAISKGIKPNEKLIYDGLTRTYYSVPNVIDDTNTLETRIPITEVISKGEELLSYAYDGKFINYVCGYNRVKSRDFAFLGPHMIDYRVDKIEGITYIVENYNNIKHKSVKTMKELSRDEESIFYNRDLEKDNFFIVVKGKHIDYKKARFEYLSNGDPVIFIEEQPLYILNGFKNARNLEVYKGSLYNGELKNQAQTVSTTNTNQATQQQDDTGYRCTKGDCINGWGQVKVNNIVTDATFKDGKIEGVAYITYPNGSYYHGEYKNNRRSGTGYYKWSTGNVYIGEWKDGIQHGYGYTMNSNGDVVSAGIYEEGKLVTDLGSAYVRGTSLRKCVGDCSNGFGKFTYNNGDVYLGFFKSGQRSKIGTYLWNNKSSYTGTYTADGRRNGYGMYTYVDRSVFKGMFTNDRIDGLGVMNYSKSGNVVQGVFNNKGAKIKDYE